MEKRFLSKRYCVDTETVMGQAAGLAGNYDDVINLSLGDPDIITPLPIIEQAFEDAKAGYTKYTDCRGYKELREEIAKYYKEEFGMQVSDEEIMVTASGCIAMYLALEAILDDGDEVIVPYTRRRLNLHEERLSNWILLRKNTGRLTLIVLRAVLQRKQR